MRLVEPGARVLGQRQVHAWKARGSRGDVRVVGELYGLPRLGVLQQVDSVPVPPPCERRRGLQHQRRPALHGSRDLPLRSVHHPQGIGLRVVDAVPQRKGAATAPGIKARSAEDCCKGRCFAHRRRAATSTGVARASAFLLSSPVDDDGPVVWRVPCTGKQRPDDNVLLAIDATPAFGRHLVLLDAHCRLFGRFQSSEGPCC